MHSRPKDEAEQALGKAHAELHRGSGFWPWQPHQVSLEPPFSEYDWQRLTLWDLYFNEWEGPYLPDPDPAWHIDYRRQYELGDPILLDRVPLAPELAAVTIVANHRDPVTMKTARHFLHSLPKRYPIAFELFSRDGQTLCRFVAPRPAIRGITAQLHAHYPQARIQIGKAKDGQLATLLDGPCTTVGFYLKEPHVHPLSAAASFDHDPLQPVLGVMDDLRHGHWALLQILFCPAQHEWRHAAQCALDHYPSCDLAGPIREKFASPTYAVSIRLASTPAVARSLATWTSQFAGPAQRLKAEKAKKVAREIRSRAAYRPGLLLSLDELTGLVHIPSPALASPTLPLARTTVKAPLDAGQPEYGSVHIGTHTSRGRSVPVYIPFLNRQQHVHITGKTRSGKSTLMTSMALQDIGNQFGVVVIDPHGPLVQDILLHYPRERRDDLTYFDFSDTDYPISFNPLDVPPADRERVIEEILTAFKRVYRESWGERLHNIFLHTLWTILHQEQGTFDNFRLLLVDASYRSKVVATIKDKHVRSWWELEFPGLTSEAKDALLNKLRRLFVFSTTRNILCQPKNRLPIREIVQGGKVLLVNLALHVIGPESASMIGSLIVNRIMTEALKRNPATAAPCWLYADEFQTMMAARATDFDVVLTQASKFGLYFAALAHHYMQQLPPDVRASVNNGPGTAIHFLASPDDAPMFAKNLDGFVAEDLLNLQRGQAIAHVGTRLNSFNFDSPPPLPKPAEDFTAEYVQDARSKLATPVAEVNKLFTTEDEPARVEPAPKASTSAPTFGKCPKCGQGRVQRKKVSKAGTNYGRTFYCCSRGRDACGYFSWIDPTTDTIPPIIAARMNPDLPPRAGEDLG